jgi:hypothetical protein
MKFTWGDASCSGIMALAGCGSGGISSSSGIAQTGTVIGQVVSAANAAVAGATVSTTVGTTTTAADVSFTVPAGTVNVAVLPPRPPITMNGTLNFTPF